MTRRSTHRIPLARFGPGRIPALPDRQARPTRQEKCAGHRQMAPEGRAVTSVSSKGHKGMGDKQATHKRQRSRLSRFRLRGACR